MSAEEDLDLSDWDDIIDAEPEKEVSKTEENEKVESDDENWDDVIAIEVLENYCGTLMNEMEVFRKQGILCDAIIAVDDTELPVHKNVISAISPFFKNIFSKLNDPTTDNKITLRNLSGTTMDDILHFCYTGEVCVHDGNVRQLLAASNFLQLNNLKEMTVTYLEKKLNPANFVDILLLADKHKCGTLLQTAERLIADNFIIVSKTNGFKKLSFEMLHQLIQSENIRVSKEEDVYRAVMMWLETDSNEKETRLSYLPNLLREIRFPLMAPSFITEVSMDSIILKNSECYDIVNEGIAYHNPKLSVNKVYDQKLTRPRKFMGTVLGIVCAGGWHKEGPIADVYAYTDTNYEWFPLKSLPNARYNHSVVACDSFIYVIGGRDEDTKLLSSVVRFDPSSNKWQDVKPLPFNVASCGVCVFQGQIYVVGGFSFNGSLDSVFKYSSRYNVWQKVGNLKYPRGACAVVADDFCIYAIGGMRKSGKSINTQWEYLDTMETFQRETNSWAIGNDLLSKRAFGVAVCINQKIFLAGGHSKMLNLNKALEIYNISTRVWTSVPYPGTLRSTSGIAVFKDKFYIVGGVVKDGEVVNAVDIYDTSKGRYKKSAPLPKGLSSMQCCALQIELAVLHDMNTPLS